MTPLTFVINHDDGSVVIEHHIDIKLSTTEFQQINLSYTQSISFIFYLTTNERDTKKEIIALMKNKKGKNLLPKHLFLNPSFVSMVTK